MIIDVGGYWRPLAELLRSCVEGGFADRAHLDVVAFIDDLGQLLPTLAVMPRSDMGEKALDRL